MFPPVRIEHGTFDSKSDTLLSELTWHVLLNGSIKFCLLFIHHLDHLDDSPRINRA